MFAHINLKEDKSLILFSTQHLPETISSLLEEIGYEQSVLSKLLSHEIISESENSASVSLRIFLSEIKHRLNAFMLTFNEISVQMSFFKDKDITTLSNNFFNVSSENSDTIFTEILTKIKILNELFNLLNNQMEDKNGYTFFKDLVDKSLIFYKQTHIVLNGYLRIYKVNSETR